MNSVYIVMAEDGKLIRVFRNKSQATLYVNMYAAANLDMDVNRADCPPLDFDGALLRYGWADKCWWQKEVVY